MCVRPPSTVCGLTHSHNNETRVGMTSVMKRNCVHRGIMRMYASVPAHGGRAHVRAQLLRLCGVTVLFAYYSNQYFRSKNGEVKYLEERVSWWSFNPLKCVKIQLHPTRIKASAEVLTLFMKENPCLIGGGIWWEIQGNFGEYVVYMIVLHWEHAYLVVL